jgi:hypothetical protein
MKSKKGKNGARYWRRCYVGTKHTETVNKSETDNCAH